MKEIKYLFLITACFTLFNCVSTQNQTLNDGSSMEKAIKVGSVAEEYKIARNKCPDCQLKSQTLSTDDKGKPFDILTYTKPNGETVNYYFDISKFFGKF